VFFRLSQDATATGTSQVTSALISFTLDNTGSIPGSSSIWGNDELLPSGTFYIVSVLAAGGGLVWGSENIAVIGASPVNINQAIPSSSGGTITTPGMVLLNPVGDQVITSGNLTVNNNLTVGGILTAGTFSPAALAVAGTLTAKTIGTATNCLSAASPAVCGSAAAGSVLIPTGTTSSNLTVNTTAVTANSQIIFYPDDSLGTRLGVTCNSTLATLAGGSFISARVAGASFTITFNGTIVTNGVCGTYTIIN
jgi:hypothetical protein